uniref:Uncharacterized protein n=1 Tax=Panagrellus redivivus TaxID=6233 RepID=A0A7E4VPE1_PANRE
MRHYKRNIVVVNLVRAAIDRLVIALSNILSNSERSTDDLFGGFCAFTTQPLLIHPHNAVSALQASIRSPQPSI